MPALAWLRKPSLVAGTTARTPLASKLWSDDEGDGTEVSRNGSGAAASGGAIYGLGIFGAWVFFWQQADTFWEYLLAVLEGLVWPAFLVYEAFSALAG
jgi:hypothetical protein